VTHRYRWIALSNTTLAIFMSALDGSIVISPPTPRQFSPTRFLQINAASRSG
jgi:hypothetical protein